MNLKSIQKPIFTSLLLALFDNYIKYLIRVNNVQENEIIENILTIDLTYNTGIAFGLLSEKTKITFFISLGVLIWLILQFNKVQNESLEYYSLVLILGGAFGNLGERGYNLIFSNNGKVTDFIELLFIPSFNLADSFISIGIFLLMRLHIYICLIITLIILISTSIGVIQSLQKNENIKCACLGSVLNLPMTEATLIENFTMIVMSLIMLFSI